MKKQSSSEAHILVLLTEIQEQVNSLDKKMDVLMTKCLRPANEPRPALPQTMSAPSLARGPQNTQPQGRPMYRAVCADCQKECEVPFKPTGERPVYCKECFARRKNVKTLNLTAGNKPQGVPLAPVTVSIPEAPKKAKKQTAGSKKVSGKKKAAAKKKK